MCYSLCQLLLPIHYVEIKQGAMTEHKTSNTLRALHAWAISIMFLQRWTGSSDTTVIAHA